MSLKFYNTLTRSLEEFKPIQEGRVGLYTCGPTVYNYAHIGNFRAYIFEDILRRTLKFCGYDVTQVMNLTDVDDKTIRDSREKGMGLDSFTSVYKKAFFDDIETLNIEKAEHYPEATKHIQGMIKIIESLIDKGVAYIGDDSSVYFSIEKFPSYGCLAHIDMSGQRAGARVKSDEYGKESVADFALWKHWVKEDGNVHWDSPWGRGRPGWHIECSAMSIALLGNHFDIHTGGIDNMFPHHEDEIAQSEASTGEKFVNYWLHCAHLIVNGEKMSKSLGNFYTLRDLIKEGYTGREIRWLIMSVHYRQHLNFTFDSLIGTRSVLKRIDAFFVRLKEKIKESEQGMDDAKRLVEGTEAAVRNGLEDDLNTSAALAAFFDFMKDVNRTMDADEVGGAAAELLLDFCRKIDAVFGALNVDKEEDIPADIIQMAEDRIQARTNRDFAKADKLRDEITARGWRVEDTAKGHRIVKA